MIIQFLVSLAATLSFAVLFSAEKKQLFFCGLTGALGWIVYLICLQYHTDNAIANLIATFALTLVARILSAVRRTPVTVFLLTGSSHLFRVPESTIPPITLSWEI